ncbi:MAG TPA: glycine zipper 2TM domain-containing protein [Dokdonella sp.]|nr:glycine zipper 2TM domain-containing protein [Dokdonella sp.]
MNICTKSGLPIAIAVAAALAACSDKRAATRAANDAPAAAATAPAQASTDAPPGEGLTAREMISAPRGSLPATQDAQRGAPAGEGPVATRAPANVDLPTPTAADDDSGRATARDDVAAGAGAPRYANVISVQPVKQTATREREECRDERIVHKRRPKDDHQVAGTVIGALAGGVIGHQVGGGRGRDLATVAGAVGGGYAGKKIQQGQQDRDTYVTTERRCRTVKQPVEDVAYDVVYEYLGRTHEVRLDHDPGDRVELPVRGIE